MRLINKLSFANTSTPTTFQNGVTFIVGLFLEPLSWPLNERVCRFTNLPTFGGLCLKCRLRFILILSVCWTQRALDLATVTQQLSGGLLMKTHKHRNYTVNWGTFCFFPLAVTLSLTIDQLHVDNFPKCYKILGVTLLQWLWPYVLWPWDFQTKTIKLPRCSWLCSKSAVYNAALVWNLGRKRKIQH